jgi:SAM-dependent methyltransferase
MRSFALWENQVNDVQGFWNEQAKTFGSAGEATTPDTAYRGYEIRQILRHITGHSVLDVGCGNGYSTFKFKLCYPDKVFVGIDYSAAMIEQANQYRGEVGLSFEVANVLNLSRFNKYDCIISERCLINLATWQEQQAAMINMREHLNPNGRIILVENFVNGLDNLNLLRGLFDLEPISMRWHNRYFQEDEFLPFMNLHFKVMHSENIGNLYYIISRVVNAALAKREKREPEYSDPLNEIAAKLPPLGAYDFSPNWLYVLKAK